MTATELSAGQSGSGEPPARGAPRLHRSPWRWWLLGAGALLVAAVVVAGFLTDTYQPVGFGGGAATSFAGLPTGKGIRMVDTFGGETGQIYLPPQAGVFTIAESITNSGPEAVTVEAVSMVSPRQRQEVGPGFKPWPLVSAGPVRWSLEYRVPHQQGPFGGKSVAGLSLAPGQSITVGMPLRMSNACYIPNTWTGLDTFYVKERFLAFTHWVAIQMPIPLLMQQPAIGRVTAVCPHRS